MLKIVMLCVALMLISVGGRPLLAAEKSDFAGKTVNVLVGFRAGGLSDSAQRLAAPFYSKYLPGNPKVFIQNMPGAAGMVAANHFYKEAPSDGTMMAVLTRVMSRVVRRDRKVKFSIEKMPIIGLVPASRVLAIQATPSIQSFEDVLNSSVRIKVGTSVQGGLTHLLIKSLLGEFGKNMKYVWGYRGSSKVLNAIRGGEVSMGTAGAIYYLNGISDKNIVWGCQMGMLFPDGKVVTDKTINLVTCHSIVEKAKPEILNSAEYKEIKSAALGLGTIAAGTFVLAPGTEENIVRDWTRAIKKTYADPAFQAIAKRIGLPLTLISPDNAREIIKQMMKPEVRDILLSLRKK